MAKRRSAASARESLSTKRQRAGQIADQLAITYADAVCALEHQDAFQLLAATILSAQCTDERVNQVTPKLFAKYPTPAKLARAKQADVEAIVRSTGFFRNKAANLIGMAAAVVAEHGGELPRTLEALVALPGVGRKTANVVLGTAYGLATGVVVDTHVKRIARLLGLTAHTDPEKVEVDLMKLLPESEWINFSHRLIHHGRQICIARRPQCATCPLLALCPRIGLSPLTE